MEIEVIIWDVDGTLWRNDKLSEIIKKSYINYLSKVLKKSSKEVEPLFLKKNNEGYCWSQILEILGKINQKKAILEVEKNINKSHYIVKDNKLLTTFNLLKNYRHMILTNSAYESTISVIKALKLSYKNKFIKSNNILYVKKFDYYPFEKIFSLNKGSEIKPKISAFLRVLKYTNLPPNKHLMIGDSIEIDLIPAKKLGMKTCLVYSDKASNCNWIDFHLPDVYSVPSIFSKKISILNFFKNLEKKFINLIKK
jgi:FMN phosphatase YigB (HAD superfamily)